MEKIISPVDTSLIESELTPERFLRHTNRGGNLLYVVDAHCAPNTMREIGRLREIAFRTAGGGTGLGCDIACDFPPIGRIKPLVGVIVVYPIVCYLFFRPIMSPEKVCQAACCIIPNALYAL